MHALRIPSTTSLIVCRICVIEKKLSLPSERLSSYINSWQRSVQHKANLAVCLDNLSIRLSDLGRREEALNTDQEAIEFRRQPMIG
jgi:Tetratricopeptide repeat